MANLWKDFGAGDHWISCFTKDFNDWELHAVDSFFSMLLEKTVGREENKDIIGFHASLRTSMIGNCTLLTAFSPCC